MTRRADRAPIAALLVLGLILLALPAELWLQIATAFSADAHIGDAGIRQAVAETGRVAGGVCAVAALACWKRNRLAKLARWIATCGTVPWLAVLAVAAIGPRLIWMQVTHTTPHVDLAWYDMHARDLMSGWGYVEDGKPTAFWPIGYPLFLVLLYTCFGTSLFIVKAAQTALAYGTCILLWRVGRDLLGEGGGRLAALVYAVCPSTIMFTELLSTETVFAVILVGVWYLALTQEDLPWRRRIYLGLLVGYGILVKPVLLPWPALALLLTAGWRKLPRGLLDCAVVYGVAALVVAPWTYRNYRVFGRFVLVGTNAGFNLYVGNAPGATGAVRPLPPDEWAPYKRMENEAERDAAMKAAAVEAMRRDPGRILALVPAKLAALLQDDSAALRWAGSAPGVSWSPVRALLTRVVLDGYYYAALALTAVWGVRRGWRGPQRRTWLIVWSWAAYLLVVHAVYYGDPRYHQALWPLLALAAAGGLRGAPSRP